MRAKRSIVARTMVLMILGIVVLLICLGIAYYVTKSGKPGILALNDTLINLTNKVKNVTGA